MRNQIDMEPENGGEDTQESGRMFTQDELEEILQKRLARERRNRPGMEDIQARERELEERERAVVARERLAEAGLPAALAQVLKTDEGSIEKAIDLISGLDTARPVSWGQRPSAGSASPQEDPIRRAMGLDGR